MITRSDVSVLAVRIFALYLITQGVAALAALPGIWSSDSMSSVERVGYSVAIVSTTVIGIIVLLISTGLARRILPKAAGSPAAAGLADIQAVAIATFGLLLIAVTIPQIAGTVMNFRDRTQYRSVPSPIWEDPVFVSELVSVGVGALLCTGASYWVRLLAKFRSLGYEPEDRTPS